MSTERSRPTDAELVFNVWLFQEILKHMVRTGKKAEYDEMWDYLKSMKESIKPPFKRRSQQQMLDDIRAFGLGGLLLLTGGWDSPAASLEIIEVSE